MLTKTAFNRMKKAELVEHCLAAQQEICRAALLESEEERGEVVPASAVLALTTVMEQRDEFKAKNKELDKQVKDLKAEMEDFQMCHPCEMECEYCTCTITEDDLALSLGCGELICEGCHDEEEKLDLLVVNKKLRNENAVMESALAMVKDDNKALKKDIKELSEAKDKLNSAWAKKRDEIYSDHRKQIKEIKKEKMSCEFKKLKATIEQLNSELHDLTVENEEFREEIDGHAGWKAELEDFTHWENHPALRHKVVLDADYYQQYLKDGDLIHPDEIEELTEEIEELKWAVEVGYESLFKFIIGSGSMSDVEEIVREKMSEEFIDGNREHWDQIELFQED
mgnify:FL=1